MPHPEYDDSWIEEEAEALTEQWFPIEYYTNDGNAADAYMSFQVNFNVTAEYDAPDLLMITMETDAPDEALGDGAVVVQWA